MKRIILSLFLTIILVAPLWAIPPSPPLPAPGTASNVLQSDGTNWVSSTPPLGAAHSLLSTSHTDASANAVARGALITGQGSTPLWKRLTIGSAGKILYSDGSDAAWSTFTLPATITSGDLLYGSAANVLSALGKGTARYLLEMDPSGNFQRYTTDPVVNSLTFASLISSGIDGTHFVDASNTNNLTTPVNGQATLNATEGVWKWYIGGAYRNSLFSTLATNTYGAANSVWAESNKLCFEGATANAFSTCITVADATANRVPVIPDRAGQFRIASPASVIDPSTNSTLTVGLSNLYTYQATDNQDSTITFSGAGTAGEEITIIFKTVSTGDEIITFHATLVSSTGTLTLGTTANRYFVIKFISDGSHWYEVSRTGEQT
jgi:hypothetical protein